MNETMLGLFFENPMKAFGVRELSRDARLDPKTVMKYLKDLIKNKLIVKKKEPHKYPYYEANRLSRIYRYEKSYFLVKKILRSRLIEFLEEELKPKAIVLFGSVWKGTYYKGSDIDIFIYGKQKKLELEKYKKEFDRDINLLFEKDLKKLPQGLINNIKKGYLLSGDLE